MNEITAISWLGNGLIISGMWGLSNKCQPAFLLTAAGNFAWAGIGLSNRDWALTTLGIVLAGISIRGFVKWLSTQIPDGLTSVERHSAGKNVCVSPSKPRPDNVRFALQHRTNKKYVAYCSTVGEPVLVNDVALAETFPTAALARMEMHNCHPFWALKESVFEAVIVN